MSPIWSFRRHTKLVYTPIIIPGAAKDLGVPAPTATVTATANWKRRRRAVRYSHLPSGGFTTSPGASCGRTRLPAKPAFVRRDCRFHPSRNGRPTTD